MTIEKLLNWLTPPTLRALLGLYWMLHGLFYTLYGTPDQQRDYPLEIVICLPMVAFCFVIHRLIRRLTHYKVLSVWMIVAILAGGCQSAERTPCTETTVATKAPPAEVAALKQYLATRGISATADDRGFYYVIQSPGSGTKPTVCSTVMVNYAGKLTNGETFDSANHSRFDLNQLIVGWQEGIPLIAAGGSITLYLPPSLAYGPQEQNGIPANSMLVFTIHLVRVG